MSQENVEVARRIFTAFNRTFAAGTADLFEFIDPEIEWIPITALLEGTRYRSRSGVRRWIEDMKRDWEVWETIAEEFPDLGDIGFWLSAVGTPAGVPAASRSTSSEPSG